MAQEHNPASEPLYTDASSTRSSRVHENTLESAPANTASDEQPCTLPKSKPGQPKVPTPLVRTAAPTAHINALPLEILAHIFRHVLGPTPPELSSYIKLLPQDILSHVCTHWRRVATSSHKFWSLIDLEPLDIRSGRYLDRARTYAARASPAPLHVRISLPYSDIMHEGSVHLGLAEFVATIAPQIQSFYVYANGKLTGSFRLILENCLARATPGILSTLMIKAFEVSDEYHAFIDSVESPNTSESLLLDVDQEHLEAVLLPVRVLWLERLYPYWTSGAYHGLTELRIHSTLWPVSITESQLLDILVNSPKLRSLEFSLKVTHSNLQRELTMPVPLAELENMALNIGSDNEGQGATLERLLRLLAPGPKPFSLTIIGGGDFDIHMLNRSVRAFLSRTNIQKVYLAGNGTYSTVTEVLRLSPHLRELSLRCLDVTRNYAPAETHANTRCVSGPGLVSLCLDGCVIELDVLRRMVEDMKIRSLSVLRCRPVDGTQHVSEETIRAGLSDLCPVTRAAGMGSLRDGDMEWEQHPELTGYI